MLLSLYSYQNSMSCRVQAYSYIQLCSSIWLFGGEQNFCAVIPEPPLTVLALSIPLCLFQICFQQHQCFVSFLLPKHDGSCQPFSEHSLTHQSPELHHKHFNGDTVLGLFHRDCIFLLTFSISHKPSWVLQNYEGIVL